MERILQIMKRLRGRKGCPWDRQQTLRSLKRCVLEEAHEVIQAIDSKNKARLQEEIGDMLCVISLLIAIGEEKGLFDKNVLIGRTVGKMISRHPHVFGREKVRTAAGALRLFQRIKETERRAKQESLFDDFGSSFPALMAADKIQRKVSRVGFEWRDPRGPLRKMEEELRELKRALREKDKRKVHEEFGDFIFSAVNFARKLGLEAETALLETNAKFVKRFQKLEKLAIRRGLELGHPSVSLKELDRLWEEVKKA